jgi:hypothetical protein
MDLFSIIVLGLVQGKNGVDTYQLKDTSYARLPPILRW